MLRLSLLPRAVGLRLSSHGPCLSSLSTTTATAATATATAERKRKPKGYWAQRENRRAFLEEAGAALGVEKREDWVRVRHGDLLRLGGGGLLATFGNSLQAALEELYGEGGDTGGAGEGTLARGVAGGRPAMRPRVRSGHWESVAVQREFLEKVAARHCVERQEDWRRIAYRHVVDAGGSSLLGRYGNSVLALLRAVYPEQEWCPVRHRPNVPRGYWQSKAAQRAFLDSVAAELDVRRPADWSRVRNCDIEERGGRTLLKIHGWSLLAALQSVYGAEGEESAAGGAWSAALCRGSVASAYWEEEANVRLFMQALAEELGVRRPEDWYRVSQKQIREHNGAGLLARMRFVDALRLAFPGQRWDEGLCASTMKKSSQRALLLAMEGLFPHVRWLEDHLHPRLQTAANGAATSKLELDVYAPELELAVEYQGAHHYHELAFFGPLEVFQARDREKRRLCSEAGVRLVPVPYWWDGAQGSLAATLNQSFPGILRQAAAARERAL